MTSPRSFRFGVICEQMQSAEEWITKAHLAEDYGYATVLIRAWDGGRMAPSRV